jgi:predicted amidohydrolase
MRNIRVASVQFEHASGDKQANLTKIKNFVKQAAEQGVDLIVFPECCITGYWFLRKLGYEELKALAEPIFDGTSSQTLMDLAKQYNMTIGAGLVSKQASFLRLQCEGVSNFVWTQRSCSNQLAG